MARLRSLNDQVNPSPTPGDKDDGNEGIYATEAHATTTPSTSSRPASHGPASPARTSRQRSGGPSARFSAPAN